MDSAEPILRIRCETAVLLVRSSLLISYLLADCLACVPLFISLFRFLVTFSSQDCMVCSSRVLFPHRYHVRNLASCYDCSLIVREG